MDDGGTTPWQHGCPKIWYVQTRNGSGEVNYAEFVDWLSRRQLATKGTLQHDFLQDVQRQWEKFDKDGSHTLSPKEFRSVLEELANSEWQEIHDDSGSHYYFHKDTRRTCWHKPSQDALIAEFLEAHGVVVSEHTNRSVITDDTKPDDMFGGRLHLNIAQTLLKLRAEPARNRGRWAFIIFTIYLILLFSCWYLLADIAGGRGVESGIRSRLESIQFEVTPGPHGSQSIRAASWERIRTIGDLHDWLLAAVENLYSDDDTTYFTPQERHLLKARALSQVCWLTVF